MNYSIIRYILANVLGFEGIFLLLPVIVSMIYGEEQGFVYLVVAIGSLLIGGLGRVKKPKSKVFYAKEGFATVALSWIILSLVGALPLYLTGDIPYFVDALFETISGFSTTGSSILSDVEALSMTSLFWRSFTHWVGGMGVLVFVLAVLPLSGGSDMHLMKAESPGPSVGKLVPRVRQTALILYGIYVAFTIIEIICLLVAGLDCFSALTLSFGTMGTGGFGILNSSIGSYSTAVQIIISIFMIIASINFNIYYLLLLGKVKDALFSKELRVYMIILVSSTILITLNIMDKFDSLFEAGQTALFQVASLTSSTGYATADFDLWPTLSKSILFLLMFIGACAGSTGGGFKVSRLIIVVKSIKNEIISMAHPRSINQVRLENKKVPSETVRTTLIYTCVYAIILLVTFLLISIDGKDMLTNFSAVVTTFNNMGPGFNDVGPTMNFGSYSVFSKFVLMFNMLVGRLEIFPVLVLFAPGIWRLSKKKV